MGFFNWFERGDVLDQQILDRYAENKEEKTMTLRFIIDTKEKKIVFCGKESHLITAEQYLNVTEKDLAATAQHLVGCIMLLNKTQPYEVHALIGGTTIAREVQYTQKTLHLAQQILREYIALSPLQFERPDIRINEKHS